MNLNLKRTALFLAVLTAFACGGGTGGVPKAIFKKTYHVQIVNMDTASVNAFPKGEGTPDASNRVGAGASLVLPDVQLKWTSELVNAEQEFEVDRNGFAVAYGKVSVTYDQGKNGPDWIIMTWTGTDLTIVVADGPQA